MSSPSPVSTRTFKVHSLGETVVVEDLTCGDSSHLSSTLPTLVFDRSGSELAVTRCDGWPRGVRAPTRTTAVVFGVLGLVETMSARYLLVVTSCEEVGVLAGSSPVFRVVKTGLVRVTRAKTTSEEMARADREFLDQVVSCTEGGRDFYFSPGSWDVTRCAQRQTEDEQRTGGTERLRSADREFFWNWFLAQPLMAVGLEDWVTVVIDGYVKIAQPTEPSSSSSFSCVFVSRRGCRRTGMRYQSRGVDCLGNASNFVETEQIVVFNGIISSFVQTRGSVPLIWEQRVNALGANRYTIPPSKFSPEAFRRHFESQIERYGAQRVINLVNQKGKERELGMRYGQAVRRLVASWGNTMLGMLTYRAFDFHTQCKGNHFENVGALLVDLESDIAEMSYFLKMGGSNSVAMRQSGCFRTNCVDCLDRTNVVQSVISRTVLRTQLAQLGLIKASDDLASVPQLSAHVQSLWADNADYLAQQYTGTNAMKTDFTRTGKRSLHGNLKDGMNAMKRLVYHHTSQDDHRQAEIDLFLGNYRVLVPRADKGGVRSHSEDHVVVFGDVVRVSAIRGQDLAVTLTVDCNSGSVTETYPKEFLQSEMRFSELLDVEKSWHDGSALALQVDRHPMPAVYRFANALHREHFYNLMLKTVFPSRGPSRVSILLGTVTQEAQVQAILPEGDNDRPRLLVFRMPQDAERQERLELALMHWLNSSASDKYGVVVSSSEFVVLAERDTVMHGMRNICPCVFREVRTLTGSSTSAISRTPSPSPSQDADGQDVAGHGVVFSIGEEDVRVSIVCLSRTTTRPLQLVASTGVVVDLDNDVDHCLLIGSQSPATAIPESHSSCWASLLEPGDTAGGVFYRSRSRDRNGLVLENLRPSEELGTLGLTLSLGDRAHSPASTPALLLTPPEVRYLLTFSSLEATLPGPVSSGLSSERYYVRITGCDFVVTGAKSGNSSPGETPPSGTPSGISLHKWEGILLDLQVFESCSPSVLVGKRLLFELWRDRSWLLTSSIKRTLNSQHASPPNRPPSGKPADESEDEEESLPRGATPVEVSGDELVGRGHVFVDALILGPTFRSLPVELLLAGRLKATLRVEVNVTTVPSSKPPQQHRQRITEFVREDYFDLLDHRQPTTACATITTTPTPTPTASMPQAPTTANTILDLINCPANGPAIAAATTPAVSPLIISMITPSPTATPTAQLVDLP